MFVPIKTVYRKISKKLLSCYLMQCVVLCLIVPCRGPVVCTKYAGCYEGMILEAYQTGQYEAFIGMPYAFKPNRFEHARIYSSDEDHDAKTAKFDCLQKNYLLPRKPITGSEDCLYLNLYRPQNITGDAPHPVLVYIHGGGFFAGSSAPIFVGAEYFMDHGGIIIVSINYRVGAFGFLTTNDQYLPGNLGLKDQVVALNWIHDNIGSFGGNEQRLILFGQSAGAVSAHMHMLSLLSYTRFYGIIAMSGTANVPFAIDDDPEYTARQTAKYCNITNWDRMSTEHLAIALKKVDRYDLLNAGDHLKYWDVDSLVNYRPIVENPSPTAFLSQHPTEILRTGNYNPVPIMFGRVPNEGGVRVVAIMESEKLRNEFNKDFYNLMVQFLEFPPEFNSSQVEAKMKLIINEYFNGVPQLNDATRQGFMDLVTDRGFYQPLYNTIKFHVNVINTNIYPAFMYKFNFVGPYSYSPLYAGHVPEHDYGVVHSDDVIYLLRASVVFPYFDKASEDALAVFGFVKNFVNFARFRRPVANETLRECNRTTFNQRPGRMCDFIEFTNSSDGEFVVRVNNEFDTRRMEFWNDILEEHYFS